jgi:hypothetical protein
MASVPDILVTELDSPRILLVVEAKFAVNELDVKELDHVEQALKRYMVYMGAPIGLLITPKIIGIYRNQYTAKSESSVKPMKLFDVSKIGPGLSRFLCDLPEDIGGPKISNTALIFEENVQSWLEDLRVSGVPEGTSPELQDAFSDYILPALNTGIIRAAHPREAST